jgi:thiamine biosynthesis lipoprotein
MGVPFRIVLYAADEAQANRAAQAAFDRVKRLNSILSDYEPDSELSQLSRTAGTGKAVKVSDELWPLLDYSQKLARESEGAFDITVGPVVNLWRKARRAKQLPPPEVIADFLKPVGYEKLGLNKRDRTATLTVSGMKLDLGAIAKGYAADEAIKALQALGIRSALVAASGDITVSEPPPGKKGWRIEITPLDTPDAPPAKFVLLARQALATSGDLFQHVEIEGKRYSHIVNPKTGVGLADHSLVTVLARDGKTADALATTISVLGPDQGLILGKKLGATGIRVVRKPRNQIEIRETASFKKCYVE